MFQVDEKFRDALESSLGELSHCLIAKDKDSAKMALQQANKDQAGDLTIIPLKEASSLKISLDELPSNSSIQARASELVKTSKQLQPLADYLLGETLVVDDLSSIVDSTDLVGWNLVDIAGAYSGQNLIMKNRKVTDDRYIIGRQEKLELITSEIDTLNNKEEQIITRSKELFKIIADAKDQLETQNIKLENNRQSVADIEMDIVRNQIAFDQNNEQLNVAKEDLQNLKSEYQETKKALTSLKPSVTKDQQKLKSYEKVLNGINKNMLESRDAKDNFQKLLQDTRIRLIELESRENN